MSDAKDNPDIPSGQVKDNSYATQSVMDGSVPVVKDDNVKDPIDPKTADSDATLGTIYHFVIVVYNHQMALTKILLQRPTTKRPSKRITS